MKLHKRTNLVQQAEIEFALWWGAFAQKHDLTYGEVFKILGNAIEREAKYAIRIERHGTADKKGDEE